MIKWLRSRRYRSKATFVVAAWVLALLRQDRDIYMAENINFAYGYSYYFFAKR